MDVPKFASPVFSFKGALLPIVVRVEHPVGAEAATEIGGRVGIERVSDVHVEQFACKNRRLVGRRHGVPYLLEVHRIGNQLCERTPDRAHVFAIRSGWHLFDGQTS